MHIENIYHRIGVDVCVSAAGIVKEANPEGLITKSLWDKWLRTGAKLVQRGGNGRTALIAFDTIPAVYRTKIIEKYGDPFKQSAAGTFAESIVEDTAAVDYYRNYRLEDGRSLPTDHQRSYAVNAAILNAIKVVFEKQQAARARSGKSMQGFWTEAHVAIEAIREELKHSLPKTAITLQRKYADYQSHGYDALINGRFCNGHAEKITPEIENWLIHEMAVTRLSVEMVYLRYPAKAVAEGWRQDITAEAFRKRSSEPRVQQLIELKRHGRRIFRKLNGHTHRLRKADYSNQIWVSDGTSINWYYNLNGKLAMATTYMVMDGRSRKFLGWSTKEGINKENFEMQLEAYRMALRTSGAKPFQLLFDNQGGHKKSESRDFYHKLASVAFPTRAYRPSGKPVEQAFKDFQTTHLAQLPFWSGASRESHSDPRFRPNMDAMQKNIHLLPTFDELTQLFEAVVLEWNDTNYNGKGSPNHIYANSIDPNQQPLKIEELAELFWNMQGPKKYHSHGVKLRVKGEEFWYEVYDANGDVDYNFRRNNLHTEVFIKYDPDYEFTDVELYKIHPTGGYEKIADASPKREVSRVAGVDAEAQSWAVRQMALEDKMMDEMDAEMAAVGYDEAAKFSAWRSKINKQAPVMSHDDDGDDDWTKRI